MSDQDPYGYHESLKQCSLEQLVEAFNREVGNPGWVTARGFYLSALRQALVRASAECSVVVSPGSMSLAHRVRLEGQQLVAETAPPPARMTREPAVERLKSKPETWACAQDVVDALVAAFAAKYDSRVEELGEQLMEFFDAEKANISRNWVDGAILVTDEAVESALEEFIEDSTTFSDERCAEIREGAALSSEELGEFVRTRAAALFENPEEAELDPIAWTV